MQTFNAQRTESVDAQPNPMGESRSHPLRAPGHVVMVVREGACWVRRQDGSREDLAAPSVAIWEPGDWVEYGHTTEGCKSETYWSKDLSHEEWAAIFTEAFGPDAAS